MLRHIAPRQRHRGNGRGDHIACGEGAGGQRRTRGLRWGSARGATSAAAVMSTSHLGSIPDTADPLPMVPMLATPPSTPQAAHHPPRG